ncbi:MAG: electron transfer flavoprotein subunit beta/FixA family protein [Candidatus Lokiarchaeota archaeon]|nr:electron transfer flavoprotein subunit beta/FixA family protein [Candidatus Lokiarchaeota archaeon]
MNTIVLIKQVPDATDVKTDPETGRLIRDGAVTINPFDMFAIEQAIQLKEQYGGKVIVLTMGPPNAKYSLEFCLAMGADDAILLTDRAFAGADTIATSYTLAKAIEKVPEFDIIFCGIKTTDGDTGQIGADVAEFLNLPNIYYVNKIHEIAENSIIVEKQFEDRMQVVQSELPVVISMIKGANTPRFPTLEGKMEAFRKPVTTYTATDVQADPKQIGAEGSPTKVLRVFPPPKREKGRILPESDDNIAELVQFLKEKKFVTE